MTPGSVRWSASSRSSPASNERQSAEDNLRFFAALYGLWREVAAERAERYLRLMGLWERRREPVATYSRGMKQKVAIARAALHEPPIVFLEEPTTGLAPDAAKTVREFIDDVRGEGRTVFLCTHNLDEADRLCDRIAFFRHWILRLDTPAALRVELYGRATVFQLAPHPRAEDLARVRAVGRGPLRGDGERLDRGLERRSAAHEPTGDPRAARRRRGADLRHGPPCPARRRVPAHRRGRGRMNPWRMLLTG